jgi:cryptochrome
VNFIGSGTKPFHFFCFLLECLEDLNRNLQKVGSKLHIFIGDPVAVFRYLHVNHAIDKICFEQDCEPIWHERDNAVKRNG